MNGGLNANTLEVTPTVADSIKELKDLLSKKFHIVNS
jgi:hypothetical protein